MLACSSGVYSLKQIVLRTCTEGLKETDRCDLGEMGWVATASMGLDGTALAVNVEQSVEEENESSPLLWCLPAATTLPEEEEMRKSFMFSVWCFKGAIVRCMYVLIQVLE